MPACCVLCRAHSVVLLRCAHPQLAPSPPSPPPTHTHPRFHGKPPSKNKQEQRQRKYLEEVAVARATSSENPSAGA